MRNLKRQLLAGPYILWMAGFILLPTLVILYYAFTTTSGNFSLLNVTSITFSVHLKALVLSLKLALSCTLICLVLSYPLAMILNNMKSKRQGFIVFIFILPMWMNFMLRILAWRLLLSNNGVINSLLNALNLPGFDILNTPKAVVLGGGKVLLIGNVIEQAFMQEYNWNLGSGLSVVLMVFVIASMALMNSHGDEGGGTFA